MTEVQDPRQARLAEEGLATGRRDVFPGRPNPIGDRPGSVARSPIPCGQVGVVPVADPGALRLQPCSRETSEGNIRGRTAAHGIVAEPTRGNGIPAEGGLTRVRVTLHGRRSRAGFRLDIPWPQPLLPGRLEPGLNAIRLANRFPSAPRAFEAARRRDLRHPPMPPGLAPITPGTIIGGAGLRPDGTPAVVANPAIAPGTVAIGLDCNFMPGATFSDVKAEVEAFAHHVARTDPLMRDHPPSLVRDLRDLHLPPMKPPVDHPLVSSVPRHATALQPKAPAIRGFEAVTDAARHPGAGVTALICAPPAPAFTAPTSASGSRAR